MDLKKLFLAWIAGFVVMFALAGLWHMVVMKDYYAEQSAEVARPEADMMPIALGYAVLALLMAYAYPIGYQGGTPWVEGLKFGLFVGLIWILPLGLVLFGVENWTMNLMFVDVPWHLVEQGIGGIGIGLIFGRIKKTPQAF